MSFNVPPAHKSYGDGDAIENMYFKQDFGHYKNNN